MKQVVLILWINIEVVEAMKRSTGIEMLSGEGDFRCVHERSSLLRYLLVKVAPVMLGVKPSVLVRLTNCVMAGELRRYDLFCVHQEEILKELRTGYRIMRNTGCDIQVLFYDEEVLESALSVPGAGGFLGRMGYPSGADSVEMLDILAARFSRGGCPHEIGLFLGYPLSDVEGFVNGGRCPHPVKRGLWKVFGDPARSRHLMELYRFAENIGRLAICKYHDPRVCVERLRTGTV